MSTQGDTDLLDLGDPEALTDEQLVRSLIVLRGEQGRRALEAAEFPALTEQGFTTGFKSDGMPFDPVIVSGILVAHGAKIDRSSMAHKCAFLRVNEDWVWEYPDTAEHTVRYVPGPKTQMRAVSLIPAIDGLGLDLIEAKTRSGVHELVGVRSYVVEGDELTLVSARSVSKIRH